MDRTEVQVTMTNWAIPLTPRPTVGFTGEHDVTEFEVLTTPENGVTYYLEVKAWRKEPNNILFDKESDRLTVRLTSEMLGAAGIHKAQVVAYLTDGDDTPIKKSNIFEIEVKNSINATKDVEPHYQSALEQWNKKLDELGLDVDNLATKDEVAEKQDKLTAGVNVDIDDEEDTISVPTSSVWKGILPQVSPYENYLMTINGNLWKNNPSWYKHCLYVLPSGGLTIKYSAKGNNASTPAILWLDDNDNVIGYYGTTTTQLLDEEITLPANAKKVCINGVNNSIFALSYKKDISLLEVDTNPLYGKKISINGDSIAYGQGYQGGVLKIIADNYNMTLDNVAVSGGTLTSGSNTSVHHVCDTLDTMANDADYYIIMGGYNDYNYNTNQLGSITQTMSDEINKNTVYGALELICRTLLTSHPTKKIGFIITHKILNSAYTNKKFTMQQLHDAIVDVCKKYSIPYCDLFELSQFNTELDDYKKYTKSSDGVHPSKDGYETFYYPHVVNWLKSI